MGFAYGPMADRWTWWARIGNGAERKGQPDTQQNNGRKRDGERERRETAAGNVGRKYKSYTPEHELENQEELPV